MNQYVRLGICLPAAGLWLCWAAAETPEIPLFAGPKFPVGVDARNVAVGDLNGDGVLDLAVVHRRGPDVTVFLGCGNGFFGEAIRVPTPQLPESVSIGDLNGDTVADLVVTHPRLNAAVLYLGNGDGTFQASETVPTGDQPTDAIIADLNHDNAADLVILNSNAASVSVALNIGAGRFGDPALVDVGTYPLGMILEDLDADGNADLAVANNLDDDVSLLFGRGDGTFDEQVRVAAGDRPRSLVTADLNRDGLVDLAVANQSGRDISILEGAGHRAFIERSRIPTGAELDLLQIPLVARDFDQDGNVDLAMSFISDGSISILAGHGDGTFDLPALAPIGVHPLRMVAGDANGDGVADLFVLNRVCSDGLHCLQRGELVTLLGRRGRLPMTSLAVEAGIATRRARSAVDLADFDEDEIPDLVVANDHDNDVSVLLGIGDGTFSPQMRLAAGQMPLSVSACDLNEDGHTDIAVANHDSRNVSVLLGDGHGNFSQGSTAPFEQDTLQFMLTHDLNRDGHQDVIMLSCSDVIVLLGNGAGMLGEPSVFSVGGNSLRNRIALAIGDSNADGVPDAVVANGPSDDLSILRGRGDGTFMPETRVFAGEYTGSVAIADVTGDGLADLISGNLKFAEIAVLRGRGDGSFDDPISYSLPEGRVDSVFVGDVNGDGRLDICTGNWVLLARDDGGFGPPQAYSVFGQIARDMNLDGRLDLVSRYAVGLNVQPAACPADLDADRDVDLTDLGLLLAAFGCDSDCAADLDGDGDTDLDDLTILLDRFGSVCS